MNPAISCKSQYAHSFPQVRSWVERSEKLGFTAPLPQPLSPKFPVTEDIHKDYYVVVAK